MSDISFHINGRSVNARDFQNEMERAIFEQIKGSIESSVKSIHCPVHHQRPKLQIRGKDLNSLSVDVTGCCDALIEATLAKLQ